MGGCSSDDNEKELSVDGWKPGCGVLRLCLQRSRRYLSDHPVLPDGRVYRPVGGSGQKESLRHARKGSRNAVGGRCRRNRSRFFGLRRSHLDIHRFPGIASQSAKHVQDRRRTSARSHSCRSQKPGRPCAFHHGRPSGCHGRKTDGIRHARFRIGPGNHGLSRYRPFGRHRDKRSFHAFLRRIPHES